MKTTEGYPWELWFKMNEFTLRRGRDYNCQVHGMAVQIRQRAKDRGLRVSVLTQGDSLHVTVLERDDDGEEEIES